MGNTPGKRDGKDGSPLSPSKEGFGQKVFIQQPSMDDAIDLQPGLETSRLLGHFKNFSLFKLSYIARASPPGPPPGRRPRTPGPWKPCPGALNAGRWTPKSPPAIYTRASRSWCTFGALRPPPLTAISGSALAVRRPPHSFWPLPHRNLLYLPPVL
ncbi:hypothetical protein HOLleu_24546 [Holothuria leucospilota]|uniref:Uncharacterized protein n=1 Tax=Holothuria leucospilota TaxID=206669 RepID=A0A9Q1BRD5_HOLLE|nr:hypothetical protein HOLleu_24546 [Holothuria leucospilota]